MLYLQLMRLPVALLLLSAQLGALPQWSDATLSAARERIAVCSTGSKAFFAGGEAGASLRSEVDIFDSRTGAWSLEHLALPRTAAAATSVAGKVLIAGGTANTLAGGSVHTDSVELYDLATGTWSQAVLSLPRSAISAGSVAGLAFFAGGYNGNGMTDRIDIYAAATGAWSTASLSSARSNMAVWTIGNRIFFAGGRDLTTSLDVIDVYDASSSSWSTMLLPPTMIGAVRAVTVGVRAYVVGGNLSNDEVWVYDDSTGNWSMMHFSEARADLAIAAVGGRIVISGGLLPSPSWDVFSSKVDIYDIATNSWQVTSLSMPRMGHVGVSTSEHALFASGTFATFAVTNVVEIYAPGPGHGYCFGDGTGQACPCSNEGEGGRGCENSSGAGALLTSFGSASVAQADLGFSLEGAALGQTALLFAGLSSVNGGGGSSFGDGLRCAGSTLVRLGTQMAAGNGETAWDPAPPGGWTAGSVRYFQVYYRDPAGPCSSTFNTSNGVEVQFAP